LWFGQGVSNVDKRDVYVQIPPGVKNISPHSTAFFFSPNSGVKVGLSVVSCCPDLLLIQNRSAIVNMMSVVEPSPGTHSFSVLPAHATDCLHVGSILLLYTDELRTGASYPPLSMAIVVLPANMLKTGEDAWRMHTSMCHLHNNLLAMQGSMGRLVATGFTGKCPDVIRTAPTDLPDELISFYNRKLLSDAHQKALRERKLSSSSPAGGAVSTTSSSAGGGGAAASSDVVIVKVESKKRGAEGADSAQAKKAKE
jgi:hypothetical protein